MGFRYRPKEPSELDKARWREVRKKVLEIKGNVCNVCKESPFYDIDHIIPRSQGGDFWSIDNLQPICYVCHRIKSNAEVEKNNLLPRHPNSKNTLRKMKRKQLRKQRRKLAKQMRI